MEDKLQETTQQLADEEEKAKGLAKQKAKQDALIADLEERLRNSERVRIFALIVRFLCSCVTQCHRVTYRLCLHCVVDCLFFVFLKWCNRRTCQRKDSRAKIKPVLN